MVEEPVVVLSPQSRQKKQRGRWSRGGIFIGFLALVCSALLFMLVVRIAVQFVTPAGAHRLVLEEDVPLPGALPDAFRTEQNPLAPGLAILFDHFDFQALDPQTHLLFIAHTGPAPDREQQVNPHFNPETDAKNDGNVVVFNTLQKKVVGLLNIPQVAGVVIAGDLHKVYAADANDDTIYSFDEQALQPKAIKLQQFDSPDGLEYDSLDHLIFVSDPGAPANPDQTQAVDRKNQNETIIDALTDKVVARIPLGIDGKWGDDVGHVRFDPVLRKAYVVVQQLPDPDSPNPNILPPPGTARLVEIDPLAKRVVARLTLPDTCFTPHGVALDTVQHIAFVACIEANPPSLVRVDLTSMTNIAEAPWPVEVKPDILAIDHSLHLLYVACGVGISLFQIEGSTLKWLGNEVFGTNTHTIAVNEATHEIYLPLIRVGNRPVLRIMQYNPEGTV